MVTSKVTLLAILLLLLTPLASFSDKGEGSKEINIDELLEQGKNYLRNQQLNEAEDSFKKVINIDPKNKFGHYHLGIVYTFSFRFDLAESEFKKAIELDPKYAFAYYNLANVYWDLGAPSLNDINKAEEYHKKAIESNSKFYLAKIALGVIYLNNKNRDSALSMFNGAIKDKPDNGKAHYYLASIYYDKKQYKKAISHLDKSKELGYEPRGFTIGASLDELLKPYRKK